MNVCNEKYFNKNILFTLHRFSTGSWFREHRAACLVLCRSHFHFQLFCKSKKNWEHSAPLPVTYLKPRSILCAPLYVTSMYIISVSFCMSLVSRLKNNNNLIFLFKHNFFLCWNITKKIKINQNKQTKKPQRWK